MPLPDARWGARMGDKKLVDTMIKDGLWDAFNNYHMGTTAENICDVWGITREELDAFAAASQQKTEAAQAAGRFDDEIVPVPGQEVKKEIVEFKVDEFPRAGVHRREPCQAARARSLSVPRASRTQVVHTFEPTDDPRGGYPASTFSASPPATPPASTTALPPSCSPPARPSRSTA